MGTNRLIIAVEASMAAAQDAKKKPFKFTTYSRVFDGVENLLVGEEKEALKAQLNSIIDLLYQNADQVRNFQSLSQIRMKDYKGSNLHALQAQLQSDLENIAKTPQPTQFIQGIANQLIQIACREVLDEKGNIHARLIELFKLPKEAANDPKAIAGVLSAFCIEAIRALSLEILNEHSYAEVVSFQPIMMAIEQQFLTLLQQAGRYQEFANGFAHELTAIKPFNPEALKTMVQADFDALEFNMFLKKSENAALAEHIREKKVSFWIDVMTRLMADENQPAVAVILSVLKEKYQPESAAVKDSKSSTRFVLGQEKDDQYKRCMEYGSAKTAVVDTKHEADNTSSFINQLQKYINARDVKLGVELILLKEITKIRAEDRAVLETILKVARSENDIYKYDNQIARLLNDAFMVLRPRREKGDPPGLLETLVDKGKHAFSAHLLTENSEEMGFDRGVEIRRKVIEAATDPSPPSSRSPSPSAVATATAASPTPSHGGMFDHKLKTAVTKSDSPPPLVSSPPSPRGGSDPN